eukprot:Clim_evm10s4 gene=Clim_evmTU10s4
MLSLVANRATLQMSRHAQQLGRKMVAPACGAVATRHFALQAKGTPRYAVKVSGDEGTLDYKVLMRDCIKRETISIWHDIPLKANGAGNVFNFVCEMPRGTQDKCEVNLTEPMTPIKVDVKNGKPRKISYGPVLHNYGMLPQTYEDPNEINETGLRGDADPIDVVEIGSKTLGVGCVTPVKPLGILGLIDEGECDWKVICIKTDDEMAPVLNTLEDLKREKPEVIDEIRNWYRLYKTVDGKPENKYCFDGECKDQDYAINVINECHLQYKQFMAQQKEAEAC